MKKAGIQEGAVRKHETTLITTPFQKAFTLHGYWT